MNKVFLIGRVTKDLELNQTTNGISYCNFSVAVTRRFADANGDRQTDFINIVTWRTTAENCAKYLKKGSQVSVIGSIQTRTYEAQDGTKRNVVEVVAEEVEFIGSKGETKNEEKQELKKQKLEEVENDLPF